MHLINHLIDSYPGELNAIEDVDKTYVGQGSRNQVYLWREISDEWGSAR